jgi:hypothetical protein
MRFLVSLLLVLIVVFLFWPYYHLYRIDNALGRAEPAALAPLTDLDAIRANTKQRLEWALGLKSISPGNNPMAWFQQGLQRAGEVALEETINLEWVQTQLRDAAANASDKRPAYFLAAVDYAMFESWDSFIVRLGRLGYNDTYLRLHLEGLTWKITDIVR